MKQTIFLFVCKYEQLRASQVVLVVGNMRNVVQSLGQGDTLEEGNPLQYACLENPMDRGAWWVIVHRVAKSWTQLSIYAYCIHNY